MLLTVTSIEAPQSYAVCSTGKVADGIPSNADVAALTRFLLLQVLFLLYHYFAAAEMYNAIRVYIAAYVWMTGFGNFLYYYKTNDFSLPRCGAMALP